MYNYEYKMYAACMNMKYVSYIIWPWSVSKKYTCNYNYEYKRYVTCTLYILCTCNIHFCNIQCIWYN